MLEFGSAEGTLAPLPASVAEWNAGTPAGIGGKKKKMNTCQQGCWRSGKMVRHGTPAPLPASVAEWKRKRKSASRVLAVRR
ncbi:MAG: hypothetical protein WAX69_25345 [Victivallales bacterium]